MRKKKKLAECSASVAEGCRSRYLGAACTNRGWDPVRERFYPSPTQPESVNHLSTELLLSPKKKTLLFRGLLLESTSSNWCLIDTSKKGSLCRFATITAVLPLICFSFLFFFLPCRPCKPVYNLLFFFLFFC